MNAIKDNKVYTIDETSKKDYLARGFDIYGDDGKLIERSPSATVSAAEYDALLKKYKAAVEGDAHIDPAAEKSKKKGKSGGEPDVSDI